MARPREFDEQKSLTAAMRLFWEKGFHSASLGDLTAAMGIQRPSLYAAFGDKEGLFKAALGSYLELNYRFFESMLEKPGAVREVIELLFNSIIDNFLGEDLIKGCLCVNTMSELGPHDGYYEQVTREHFSRIAALFRQKIETGVKAGELTAVPDPEAAASSLELSLIGLLTLLKVRPESGTLKRAVSAGLNILQ